MKAFRRSPDEKGQVLIIVALLTTVFLGMVAMTVDIGLFVRQRGHVQDVVDAAALAGAQELPDDGILAGTNALLYANDNDSTLATIVTFRCLVGDDDLNGLADPGDIGPICDPGGNGSWTCAGGRCVSLCVPAEGDKCNTIVVSSSTDVPFFFARAIQINSANTGTIMAAACRGACGGPPNEPIDVVEILDRTGSMDSQELADAKAAGIGILDIYNPALQHVGMGALGPSLTTSTCGSPYAGGLGVDSSDQLVGSWVPVPLSSDYKTSGSLNPASLIYKTINCLQTSGVGTNLGDPTKAATNYLLTSPDVRAGVKKGIILFTDGAANNWIQGGTSTNTGYKNCASNAAVTSGAGDNNGYQTTASNACADGGGNAVDTDSGTGTSTSCTNSGKDRHRFYDYGIAIPAGAPIQGIEVRVDARVDSASGTRRICVDLSWDGGASWTSTKQTSNLGTSEATYTLGSASDTWGHGWTDTQFSNANFRVRVTDVADSTSRDFTLDWVAVRVTYSVGGSSANGPCDYAVQEAAVAKAADIEIFSLGYGLSGENCGDEAPGSPWDNLPVTQVLAAMATDSIDETGCDTQAEVDQENADGDHFMCEVASGGLTAIFQAAAEILAASPRLIQLP